MTRQEYEEKLERGIAQVRAGQSITKTTEELEYMAENKMRIAQIQLPDPADTDSFPRLLLEGRGIHAGEWFSALFPDGWHNITLEVRDEPASLGYCTSLHLALETYEPHPVKRTEKKYKDFFTARQVCRAVST